MIAVKFTASGANSLLGGFSAGDIARVEDALARHLVDEIGVAKYLDAAPAVPAAGQPQKPAAKARRKAKE